MLAILLVCVAATLEAQFASFERRDAYAGAAPGRPPFSTFVSGVDLNGDGTRH
jgi:hypothetical protein